MMKKKWLRPGDRVMKRSGGPMMTVLGYARKYSLFVGVHESDTTVECSYYDKTGYHVEEFNVNC